MERPHRQLCTWLTDRLRSNNAHGLTGIHDGTPRQITAVAQRADTFFSFTGQRTANTCNLKPSRIHGIRHAFVNQLTTCHKNLVGSRLEQILCGNPAQQTLGQRQHNLAVIHRCFSSNGFFGSTIIHADNAILRHIHQTTGQITRVGGFQCRIGQTFARAVGRVEVFKNRQTFFKVRDNRRLDDIAVWLGHQTAHAAQLFHLGDRPTRPRVGHHVHTVGFKLCAVLIAAWCRNRRHHRIGDLVVTFRPGIDNFVIFFTLSDQTVHILLFEIFDLTAGFIDQSPFVIRHHHIIFTKRNTGFERFTETHCHDLIAEDDALFLTTITVDGINHPLHVFFPQQIVDQIKRRLGVLRQQSP